MAEQTESTLKVTITRCRQLVLETAAFPNSSLSVAFHADQCQSATVHGSAFSRISSVHLSNMTSVQLAPHAFRFVQLSAEATADVLIENANLTGN